MRQHQRHVVGAVVITLACLAAFAVKKRGPTAASASAPDAPARRAPPRDLDLTFLVTADTHVGFQGASMLPGGPSGVSVDEARAAAIRAMNEIAGKPLPAELGGIVGEPRGLLIAGDLTEQGRPQEWARFEAIFGLTGKEGQIRYPVYEGAGNHDKWGGAYVEKQIARRHGGARYSWDWGDVHLVCLGEAPNDPDLTWLRADLAAAGPRGIVLFLHFPLDGANSTGNWFGDGVYREKLHEALAGREVLGIFNGHSHTSGHYRWRGHDAYLEGSPKHWWHSFAVVHVTGTRLTVASYNYDRRGFWWWHDKPIFGAPGAVRQWFADDAPLVGRHGT